MSKKQAQPNPEPVPLPSGGGSYTIKGGRLDQVEATAPAPMRTSGRTSGEAKPAAQAETEKKEG